LLVKTSSLGDVIHNLPVVGDLQKAFPGVVVDWVAEEGFAGIPRLHPGVRAVIPVAFRRWRGKPLSLATWREIRATRRRLAEESYDLVLDTQGLLKSALVVHATRGRKVGFSAACARESWAARFYDDAFFVPRDLHAVERNRRLAAAALGHMPEPEPDYGLTLGRTRGCGASAVLLTASSRDDKLWPEENWVALGRALARRGLVPLFPGGSFRERQRARRLAEQISGAQAVPPMSLAALADLLFCARLVVGVDTGLTHLAVAMRTPTLALYTATDPGLTGVLGASWHRNLGGRTRMPTVEAVLQELEPLLANPSAPGSAGANS
jgi:heptosyltransferase-1